MRISDTENLVNQQNIRIHIDRHRERQTHIHTRGIGAHWVVNKFLQLGEFDDLRHTRIDFLFAESENGCIRIYILTPAHIRVKSRTKLDETGYSSPHLDRTAVRIDNLCQQF